MAQSQSQSQNTTEGCDMEGEAEEREAYEHLDLEEELEYASMMSQCGSPEPPRLEEEPEAPGEKWGQDEYVDEAVSEEKEQEDGECEVELSTGEDGKEPSPDGIVATQPQEGGEGSEPTSKRTLYPDEGGSAKERATHEAFLGVTGRPATTSGKKANKNGEDSSTDGDEMPSTNPQTIFPPEVNPIHGGRAGK